jgi:hypothetical protein
VKKDGEWIATLSAKLEVSRVDVEANEVLDLVEVTEVDRVTGRPTSVRFFDPVEGARLLEALGTALDELALAASKTAATRMNGEMPASDHARQADSGA